MSVIIVHSEWIPGNDPHLEEWSMLERPSEILSGYWGLAASIQAEELPPPATNWGALQLNLSSLQKWGTKEYKFSEQGPGRKTTDFTGAVTLVTEVSPEAVILRDRIQITSDAKEMTLEAVHTCRKDNFLSPTRIECKGKGNDEFRTFVAEVDRGKATVHSTNAPDSVQDLPSGTITIAGMMRLVTLVPRTVGATFSFEYSLESEELNLKKNYLLTVLQPETINCGGLQVKCSKFQLTGGGIRPVFYWVTEDGTLQRMLMDDRKVMELKSP
jgi:hypothetical protein